MATDKNIFLYPVSLIYGMITWLRNFLYNTGILPSVEFHLPVICVGNITVGGQAKRLIPNILQDCSGEISKWLFSAGATKGRPVISE